MCGPDCQCATPCATCSCHVQQGTTCGMCALWREEPGLPDGVGYCARLMYPNNVTMREHSCPDGVPSADAA